MPHKRDETPGDVPQASTAPGAASPGTPSSSRGRLMGSAGRVSAATMLSRLGGLVREQLFAALLGAGLYSDAFVVAYRIPNLLRDLLAEGALSTAFVPTFTEQLVQRGRRDAYALANLVLSSLLVVTALIVLGGELLAEPLVRLIAPGFAAIPGKIELTALLTRILFPFLTLVALAAVLMGMLNAQGRFFVPAVAPALFNAAAIVVGLALLATPLDTRSVVLAWTGAVLLGGLAQLLVQVPSLWRMGWRFRWRYRVRWDDPGLRQILRLMAPAVVGLSATQVNILVNNILASQLEQGSPSWINYAFRLMQLPIGVFGVAVATVNLAAVSRDAAAGDLPAFRRTLGASMRLVAFLTIPSTLGLFALREPIIRLLYEHGRFTAHDTARTAAVLAMYAVGLYAYASVKVMAPAFYALKQTRVPLLASVAAVACNIVANLLLYRQLGAPGLALGTSIGAVVNIAVLYVRFVRTHGSLGERALALHGLRVLVASTLMALGAYAAWRFLESRLGHTSLASELLVTLVPVGVGVLLYAGLAHGLRVEEGRVFWNRLRRRA